MAQLKASKPRKSRLANGRVGANGTVVYQVRVRSGYYRGHVVTFTQHSENRYTVFGLSGLATVGMSIERRDKFLEKVTMHDSGAVRVLSDEDQWIAYHYSSRSYYGALAVGRTAQEAYERTFDQVTGLASAQF